MQFTLSVWLSRWRSMTRDYKWSCLQDIVLKIVSPRGQMSPQTVEGAQREWTVSGASYTASTEAIPSTGRSRAETSAPRFERLEG